MSAKIESVWGRTRALRPIIEAHHGEGDILRRLTNMFAQASINANAYRLLVPEDFGSDEIDTMTKSFHLGLSSPFCRGST